MGEEPNPSSPGLHRAELVTTRLPKVDLAAVPQKDQDARRRSSSMRAERASVCPLDCPDTCSLTVTVEDERVVQVRGSHANPYTAGAVCAKVARDYPDFVHGQR